MQRAATLLGSSVGRKVVMAVSGLIFFGFVTVHMIGNLQIFIPRGPDGYAINHYAVFLHTFLHGGGIWIFRFTMLASVVLHIWAATMLTIENWKARPIGYRQTRNVETTYASRTMIWSGPILALFVIYHILHFTLGAVQNTTFGLADGRFVEGDVYHNVVAGFQIPMVSVFYIVAMLALGLHMYHGIWSMLQTLGLSHPRWNRLRFAFSTGMTLLVVIGNISIPLAIMTGLVR